MTSSYVSLDEDVNDLNHEENPAKLELKYLMNESDFVQDPQQELTQARGSNLVYISFFCCGAGFLFPFNTFISAIDYFESAYPHQDLTFWFSVSYTWSTLATLFVNSVLVQYMSITARIRFGFFVMIPIMIAIPCLQVVYNQVPNGQSISYGMIIFLAGLIGIGTGVQQGSFYGYAGMFPPMYTQALMAGEGVAGVLVSANRIFTKAAFDSNHTVDDLAFSTVVYFAISTAVLLGCSIAHEMMRVTPFSIIHCASASQGIEMPNVKPSTAYSDSSLTVMSTSAKLHQIRSELEETPTEQLAVPRAQIITVAKKLTLPASLCFFNFFVTLSVYPGLMTSAVSSSLGDWYPILLVATFNVFDFLGRVVCSKIKLPNLRSILWPVILRFAFIPVLGLLISPATAPTASGTEAILFIVVLLLSISNGFYSSVLMMTGPTLATAIESELAGNIMAVSLLSGLSVGSLFALLVNFFVFAN